MITVNILWILLLGSISGLLFLLIIPFVMGGLIIYQAMVKLSFNKYIGRLFITIKDFNLPFIKAYLKGKK